MYAGFDEVLELREHLVHIGSQLDLQARSLFHKLHPETPKVLKLHKSYVIERKEPVGIHYQCFSDNESVNLIRLGLRFSRDVAVWIGLMTQTLYPFGTRKETRVLP